MVGLLSALACVVIVWQISAVRNGSRALAYCRSFTPRLGWAYCALAALPLTFLAQVVLLSLQARFDTNEAARAWVAHLPLTVFDGKRGLSSHHAFFSIAGLCLSLLETALLAMVVLAIARGISLRVSSMVAATVVMALIAVCSPVMSTADAYEYVAAGLLRNFAYGPPPAAFVGTIYESIDRVIPMRGVIYGPLWLIVDCVVTSFGKSIVDKIEMLRLLNVTLLAALIVILRACKAKRSLLVAIVVNPAVWFYVVVGPHADIEAFALMAAAHYLARRNLAIAAACAIVAAGMVKLPFVVIGGVMLIPINGVRRRLVAWIAAILAAAGLSYVTTGHAYARDLLRFTSAQAGGHSPSEWVFNAALVALALIVSIVLKRGLGGCAILFNQIGPVATPWYLLWGFPYAVVTGVGETYLIALPLLATLAEDLFELTIITKCLIIVVAQAAIIDQVYFRKRRPKVAAFARR